MFPEVLRTIANVCAIARVLENLLRLPQCPKSKSKSTDVMSEITDEKKIIRWDRVPGKASNNNETPICPAVHALLNFIQS